MDRLRARYGDRIPRSELSRGVTVLGERIPIWNGYKGIHKPAVLGTDGAALTIQTSAESPYNDSHDEGTGEFVYKYRGEDSEQADNRALRAAKNAAKPILYLIAVDPGFYDAIWPVYVTGERPEAHEFTLVADDAIALAERAPAADISYRRRYRTYSVMTRLHQVHFRRIVLHAYRERCAICRLRHVNLLDAAHILRDNHPLGEPVIPNGLGLCKIHHSAFDANILGIDRDARIHIREDVLQEKDGPMLEHGLKGFDRKSLVLPKDEEHHPNPDFLAERFDEFRAA